MVYLMRLTATVLFNRYFKATYLFGIVLAFFVCSHTYASNVAFPEDDWQISHKESHSEADDLTSGYCIAKVVYNNGDDLVLARDYSGALSLAYKSHSPFTAAPVTKISIDQLQSRSLDGKTIGKNTIILPINHDREFLDAMMAGQVLHISHGSNQTNLSLNGSADGIRSMNECLKAASGHQALLSRKSMPNDILLPMPGSLAKMAPASGRYDAFTDPSRTYIQVHFPNQNNMPVAAAPVAKVEKSALNALGSCHVNASKNNLLHDSVKRYFEADNADISLDNLTLPISWETAGVKSNLIVTDVIANNVKDTVLNNIKSSCGGDFALNNAGSHLWHGNTIDSYSAACFDQGQQTVVNINFISDGFQTAIYSLETPADNIAQSNLQQSKLLSAL